ncbi:MAG: ABC transporter permease [Gammaproteobacteria bacterium]|nr:ABC transporter permease [Gammaproteobacteria bacterium]
MDSATFILALMDSAVRMAVPLVFAAMAGICAERSGIVDIGLEGKMLAAAFAGAAMSAVSGSAVLGVMAAIGISIAFSMVHGFATITQRGDHVISGLAINFLASGLTVVLGAAWFKQGGQTPTLSGDQRFMSLDLPGAEWAAESLGVVGQFYDKVISGHNLLVYLSVVAVALVWWVLTRTTFGLRLRAVGESPHAVDTAGISVAATRYKALLLTGVLCGFAGAYLSLAQTAGFQREMSAGQGYIALAAVIFGKWRPWQTLGACYLFGILSALEARMQGVEIPLIGTLPTQIFAALPYVLTVILLAGFIGRAIAPKAIGQPYVKER